MAHSLRPVTPPADSGTGSLSSLIFRASIRDAFYTVCIAAAFGGVMLLCLAPLFGGWR